MTKPYSQVDDNGGLCEHCNDPVTVEQVQQTYPLQMSGGLGWGTLWLCPLCLAKATLRDQDKSIPAIASSTRGEPKPQVVRDEGWRDVAADFIRLGKLVEAIELINAHLSAGWLRLGPQVSLHIHEQGVSARLHNDGLVTARVKLTVFYDLRDEQRVKPQTERAGAPEPEPMSMIGEEDPDPDPAIQRHRRHQEMLKKAHGSQCHPDYEYEITTNQRKSGDSPKPEGDGWEPNLFVTGDGRNWERFEYHESNYWMRRLKGKDNT